MVHPIHVLRAGGSPKLTAEANGCFMVRVLHGPDRIQGCGASIAPERGRGLHDRAQAHQPTTQTNAERQWPWVNCKGKWLSLPEVPRVSASPRQSYSPVKVLTSSLPADARRSLKKR